MNSALLFLVQWGVRSSALILIAAALLWMLRVRNPSLRLTVWTVVLAASFTIPPLAWTLPSLPLRILRAPQAQPSASVAGIAPEIHSSPIGANVQAMPVSKTEASEPFDWAGVAVIVYALIAIALLGRVCVGLVLSRRLFRGSVRTPLVLEGTAVYESGQINSPMTIGIIGPAMLLPSDWKDWNPNKLAAVLAHESSHIRRRDPALQLLSMIHRALLWASPLSWMLHRSIIRNAEQISDDDAVVATSNRALYAETLLHFMQRGGGGIHWVGVPMARYERPETRIRRILNAANVARGISRYGVAGITALGAPLAYVAAVGSLQSATSPPLKFEVATIKPSTSHQVGVQLYPRAKVAIRVATVKSLVATAFGLPTAQVSTGQAWTQKDRFDLEAQPSPALQAAITDLSYTNFTIEDPRLREMLQSLLIDRFQLKFHRETKSAEVYFLERNGTASPLKAVDTPIDPDPTVQRGGAFGSIGYVGGQWSIWDTTMPQFAQFAGTFVTHTPMIDRTGLAGRFTYREKTPDVAPIYSGDQEPSFRNYLNEVGLKLERGRAPVETLVIDHAERPSAN